ncbi:uncharacterized protein SCHCODRAFT_02119459 [Schizophyllum commune H4-8]|uniref:uncharacterized protein n=1 Tax=Schizophyllum commune (strain H4-8 / FGSC 9210) TaxID=578458 RepID=UPI0021602903|nr:uncharacterized protein SCHCODRAFT_02119459 [Schizophyllum commune H4-8]KAI5885614.1 hypothetical protein SCHCODRAFT_02119459 [Schizophyllum commune H4-8]
MAPGSFIKYSATIVYEHERAKELFALDKSELRNEICKSFDKLRLPHPSWHNLCDPEPEKDRIKMYFYTESENTTLSMMVTRAFETEYDTPQFITLREIFKIREMRVRQRTISESELPQKDRSRMTAKTASTAPPPKFKKPTAPKDHNDRPPENRPLKVEPGPHSLPRDGGRSFVKYVVTVVFDREKAAQLPNKRASDLHGELCKAFELLRLPYPSGQNMEQPNVRRGSITVWWYTQSKYTILGRQVHNALIKFYKLPENREIRKSWGM